MYRLPRARTVFPLGLALLLLALTMPARAQGYDGAFAGYVYASRPYTASYTPDPLYSYNATGGAVTITRTGTGRYTVRFAGLGRPGVPGGNVQVATHVSEGTVCRSNGWSSGPEDFVAYVACETLDADAWAGTFTVLVTWPEASTPGLAYAWADQPTSASYTPSPYYTYNSGGGAVTITRSGTGRYAVTFGGLGGFFEVGGSVQVTAYTNGGSNSGRACRAESWGATGTLGYDLVVNVACDFFTAPGNPADALYTVLFTEPTTPAPGLGYAWADQPSAASYTPNPGYSYNGAGGAVTVTRSGVGTYAVRFAGLGEPSSGGNVQVMPYGADERLCYVSGWSALGADFVANVACRNPAGGLSDARYTVLVTHPATTIATLTANGPEARNLFGSAVALAGDVDRDGVPDALVGAPFAEPGSAPFGAGRAYLYSGVTGTLLRTLSSPNEEVAGYFGESVAGAGDVTGDGVPDLAVAATGEDPGSSPDGAGRVHLFDGATGALLRTLRSPSEVENGRFGSDLARAGDVNADGVPDLLVGSPRVGVGSSVRAGRAYVFSGSTGARLRTLTSPNVEASGAFGTSVAGAADANGDGVPDYLIGAPYEDGGGIFNAGRAYVFSGAVGGGLLYTLTQGTPEANGQYGFDVAWLGDATGDGRADLAVSKTANEENGGRVFVYNGATGARIRTINAPGPDETGGFGSAIARAGDWNGDGRGDLAVGRPYNFEEGPPTPGRVYVFNATTGAILREITSPSQQTYGQFGWSVAGGNEPGASGRYYLVVGALSEDVGGLEDAGRAYLFGQERLSLTLLAGSSEGPEADAAQAGVALAPTALALESVAPNPVRGAARVAFEAPAGPVRLALYDLLGREVAVLVEGAHEAGRHEAALDAAALPAGVYVLRLTAGERALTRRLTVVR